MQVSSQFLDVLLQVVSCFQTILKETGNRKSGRKLHDLWKQYTDRNESVKWARTCTEHGNTWWGSAAGPLPSLFLSRSLWLDTVGHTHSCQSDLLSKGTFHLKWNFTTSHIWSWNSLLSFVISSAISAQVISVRIIPCCLACSLFSFSIFVLRNQNRAIKLNLQIHP